MADPTPIEREVHATPDGMTTVDHFGRTWTVPLKRHFRHVQAMRNQMVRGAGDWDLMIAETFLDDRLLAGMPAGQVEALWELNPTDDDLAEFTKKIAAALGLGASGN
jgi:hypothetical protein